MQAIAPQQQPDQGGLGRKVGYFMLPPLVALALLTLFIAVLFGSYQTTHRGLVFTGVAVAGVDVSEMSPDEATAAVRGAFPFTAEGEIVFSDPQTGERWARTPESLGIVLDVEQTVDEAYSVGRRGLPFRRIQEVFQSWYYGVNVAPVFVFDEARLDAALAELAQEVDQPAVDAAIRYEDDRAQYVPGEPGRVLDTAELRDRLMQPLLAFQAADVELLVHETNPALFDDVQAATQLQQFLNGPVTFYLAEPLDEEDLQPVRLSEEELAGWLRVVQSDTEAGAPTTEIIVDENAARHWLRQFETPLYRDPVNARFYFNDDTRELVLVAPHINGRSFNLEATLQQFVQQVNTANRAVPFVVDDIVPTVNSEATSVELGITELITETTTWFYGSSDERKHNIARAAANFFGIVVAPGEEFSFNHYLGSISEADGYEEGLIIVGGRTIRGIGGGVCQVSTTLYQSAFLAGFPITERWEHGYMLGYYNDGEGPGMDATVYSPIVDMKFINNTPHHLLIENYYNEEFEALTVKMYSTSLGRVVEKSEPVFSNVVPAPTEDEWVFDPKLEPGTVVQIDWATEGADVAVQRRVLNAEGEPLIDEVMVSNYIPYPNVFHYGPGVEPGDYSLVPDDNS